MMKIKQLNKRAKHIYEKGKIKQKHQRQGMRLFEVNERDGRNRISLIFTLMPAKHFVGYNSHKLIPFRVNTNNFQAPATLSVDMCECVCLCVDVAFTR